MPKHVPMWAVVIVAALVTGLAASGGIQALVEWTLWFALSFAMVLGAVMAVTSAKKMLWGDSYNG